MFRQMHVAVTSDRPKSSRSFLTHVHGQTMLKRYSISDLKRSTVQNKSNEITARDRERKCCKFTQDLFQILRKLTAGSGFSHLSGLAFLISHLTRQRHFSGPLFIVRGHAMTWAGSGRDLGLSEVTATCIWRNIRFARFFF